MIIIKEGICLHCKNKKKIKARGLCAFCYFKLRDSGGLENYPVHSPRMIICKRCKKLKKHHSRGFCLNCYHYETNLKVEKGTVCIPLGTKDKLKKYRDKKQGAFFDDVLKDMKSFLKKC